MGEELGDYTPWLIRKSEREFLGLILEYYDEVLEHAKLLSKEVECVTSGDYTGCMSSHTILNNRSRESAVTRKKLIRRLEQAGVTPENRGYLIRTLLRIGSISSYIDSASARLSLREVLLKDSIRSGIREMMSMTMQMFNLLRESLVLLNENLEKAIEKTGEIELIEEEIDDLRRGLLKELVNDPSYTDPAVLHVLIEVIGSLETVSDKVADAAHQVEISAITHLP